MKESDIKVLNFIIEKVIETKGRINYTQVVSSGMIIKENHTEQILEFKRLLKIIEHYNCAKVVWSDFFDTVDINEYTKDFIEIGGFEKCFQDELNLIEKENERKIEESEFKKLQTENLTLQNTLLDLQTKQLRKYIRYSIISFIFGAIVTNGKDILKFLQSVFQE